MVVGNINAHRLAVTFALTAAIALGRIEGGTYQRETGEEAQRGAIKQEHLRVQAVVPITAFDGLRQCDTVFHKHTTDKCPQPRRQCERE